jgi:ribonuclease Z
MLPKPPPPAGDYGFIYAPPYRIEGVSIAGEQTCIHVPELDVAFDIGLCPRIALAAPYVAISHGHMDHVAGLPYYFSQRIFQGMTTGTCICHHKIAGPIADMMRGWVALEGQRTPHEIIGLEPDQQLEIKNNIFLRGIEARHTVPALAYVVIEKRSKLKEEFRDLPQDRLRDLKQQGIDITYSMEIPLVAYTGDTEHGPCLYRDEFAKAQVVICECTFFDDEHRSRAKIGKHLHVDDLKALLDVWQAHTIVLMHVSRRTNLAQAREHIRRIARNGQPDRVHFLMDHRNNRARYEQQRLAAGAEAGAGPSIVAATDAQPRSARRTADDRQGSSARA